MQHLYGVQSSVSTHQQPTHLQQSVALLQLTICHCQMNYKTSTSKTAKEFEFGSLHKDFNLFENNGVHTLNLDMLLSALRTHTANFNRQ
jgi:hypothetical protein